MTDFGNLEAAAKKQEIIFITLESGLFFTKDHALCKPNPECHLNYIQ